MDYEQAKEYSLLYCKDCSIMRNPKTNEYHVIAQSAVKHWLKHYTLITEVKIKAEIIDLQNKKIGTDLSKVTDKELVQELVKRLGVVSKTTPNELHYTSTHYGENGVDIQKDDYIAISSYEKQDGKITYHTYYESELLFLFDGNDIFGMHVTSLV